jgi:hypothetical protein
MAPHWRLHYCDAGGRQTASSSAEMIRAPVFEQPGHCHSVSGIPRRLLAMASAPRTTFVAPIYFQRSRYRAKVFNLPYPSGPLRHMMARPARHPMIRNSMKRTKNIPNSILAIPAAAPAIPPNPRAAATMEMTKKTAAQYSIDASFRQKYASQHFGSAVVVWQVRYL